MEITKDLELLLFEKFTYAVSDIAKSIFERVQDYEEEDLEDALQYAMDDELIYDDDLWQIMRYYQRPCEANLSEAIELFFNDLLDILYKVNA